jgi:hypothetical protein
MNILKESMIFFVLSCQKFDTWYFKMCKNMHLVVSVRNTYLPLVLPRFETPWALEFPQRRQHFFKIVFTWDYFTIGMVNLELTYISRNCLSVFRACSQLPMLGFSYY